MFAIRYPPPHVQRVLALEAPGGEAVGVRVVLPTVTAAGRPVGLRMAVSDALGLPSVSFDGAVVVRGPFAGGRVIEVPFRKGRPAVAEVVNVILEGQGFLRVEAEMDGRVFPSNPALLTTRPATPIWWGDPHVHSVLSQCHPERCRSVQFGYAAARYASGLDWVSVADHVSNGRCDLGKWKEESAACEAHDDPPRFVTLPAYEASFRGGAGGDNNVYMRRWPSIFAEGYEDGTVKSLCEALGGMLSEADFFVVPHHTTRAGKHGELPDSIYPGPTLMPVIEVHSKWGAGEYRGNPNPLQKVHEGPSYAVDLLSRGLRLGFIGGTDTHATLPAGFGDDHLPALPGMTAARAPELSRDGVFDAVRARRCYGTSLERVYLDVRVAGVEMGGMVEWSGAGALREVVATVAAESRIESIEVVRNGETVHRAAPGDWHGTIRWRDESPMGGVLLESSHLGRFAYYYVRVTCASGAQAWSSPVWLRQGG